MRGDIDEAESLHSQALAIARADGNFRGESQELYRIGDIKMERGDLVEAERLFRKSVRICIENEIQLRNWYAE